MGQQNIIPNQTGRNCVSPHENHFSVVSNSEMISPDVTSIGHIIWGSHIQYELHCDFKPLPETERLQISDYSMVTAQCDLNVFRKERVRDRCWPNMTAIADSVYEMNISKDYFMSTTYTSTKKNSSPPPPHQKKE